MNHQLKSSVPCTLAMSKSDQWVTDLFCFDFFSLFSLSIFLFWQLVLDPSACMIRLVSA